MCIANGLNSRQVEWYDWKLLVLTNVEVGEKDAVENMFSQNILDLSSTNILNYQNSNNHVGL